MARYAKVIEADAEALLVAGVRSMRGLCLKMKFFGLAGAPDRLVLLPGGRFFFVEVKQVTGRLEASQANLFPRLEALGFEVYLLYGIDAVQRFLQTTAKG